MDLLRLLFHLAQLIVDGVLLLGLWSLYKAVSLAFNQDLRKIPGPWLSSLTNARLKWAVLRGYRTTYIHALHQKYGSFVRIGPAEVSVADYDAWRRIHRVGSDFTKYPGFYQSRSAIQYDDNTCAVFGICDLKKASARRKLFLQAGTRKIMVEEWESHVIQSVQLAVQSIKRDLEAGKCDVMKWWTFLALDVSSELAFGESFGLTKSGKKSQLIQDMEDSMLLANLLMELPLLFHLAIFSPLKRHYDANLSRLQQYGAKAVQNTKQTSRGLTKTLFSKMLPEDGSQKLADSIVEQEAGNVLLAGTDTTAMTLTYLTFAVLKLPAVKSKLIAELKTCPENPTWEQLEELPYLNNVIKESMRRYPAIPGSLPRVVPKGGVSFGKYVLPERTVVCTQAYTFQLDPTVFEDPLRFNPDRWISPTPRMNEQLQVFGGPSRVCIGQNIAKLQIYHAVSRFFTECGKIKLAETTSDQAMEMVDHFSIKPRAKCCFIVPE